MNNLSYKLICKMYPGDSLLCSFDSLSTPKIIESFSGIIEDLIQSVLKENNIDLDTIEVNEFLNLLKKQYPKHVGEFIEATVSFYFTHPKVLELIQNGRGKLFPNYRTLPNINYDLLIPVFERGV